MAAVDKAQGKVGITHYSLLEAWEFPGIAMLEFKLETGRTHQIRVHLASIGHPLLGDTLYGAPGSGAHGVPSTPTGGNKAAFRGVAALMLRPALHARSLTLSY